MKAWRLLVLQTLNKLKHSNIIFGPKEMMYFGMIYSVPPERSKYYLYFLTCIYTINLLFVGSESADLYTKVMEELHHAVTRMVFENYGVEEYHDDHLQSTVHKCRFNKYSEPEKTGTNVGVLGHTDTNFSTILYQNHVKGLEIYSKDDEWICFDPLPSSFIFLAGDAFQVCHKHNYVIRTYVRNQMIMTIVNF